MPSSVINRLDYDDKSRDLIIVFVSGMKYKYKNVPQNIFDGFKKVTSKGRYFNKSIKDKFAFEKMEE